jgi:nucleotide-binding universal stress UspA family protein
MRATMMLTSASERPAIASLARQLEHLPVLVVVTADADAVAAMSVAESITQRYGSVTDLVLRDARCSVLAVPPPY